MASYNINPKPVSNNSTFGSNIGQIGAPPSIYDQLNETVPNYGSLTGAATRNIGDELSGKLSTGTQNLLQDKSAEFGVDSGMPGGAPGNTLTTQNFLDSLGLSSEGLAHQGLTDYNQFATTTGNQQSDPNLLFGVASQNAIDAAAPDPTAANNYSQQLYDKYLKQSQLLPGNPAGGVTDPNAWKLGGNTGASKGLSWSPAADPTHVQAGAPGV